MNQYKKTALLWVLLLAICSALLSGCINALPGDFHITTSDETTTTSDVTVSTPPEEIPPEVTTTEEISPEVITTEQTAPEQTDPEITMPPQVSTEESTIAPEPVEKIKIYIDQGHNPFLPKQNPDDPNKGWNTGASNEALGLYEQDLTYEIGILLAGLLAQDDRFEVRLSRPTAETILGTNNDSALDFRVNDAAEWGADYFISLHINSNENFSVSGIEAYAIDTQDEGYALGRVILEELQKTTELRNRGMKTEDYRVLKNATMPAVLVEMGFISNTNDAILLRDSSELFVQGLYKGILSYFNTLEPATDVIEEET